ncbi:TRAP transporter substrate-binding protein DctP [Belnapia sp. T6]|uniref:TRAP transporter substrate-binding protein DctP n=1 Tax=Belnapia mucosa TaxID=2804532 RepID=A0ABS1V3S3_9PROT|nr:TRAP transporter substrate-binding protein DctP [Belnapia mucosa]MBL6456340.1 TRAP transporter substrate-binding protein DctP [Belnapia mucosa]
MPARRSLLVTTTFSMIGAAGWRPRPARAETIWRMATEYPERAIPGEGLTAFAAAVARRAGDALTVRPGFNAPDGLRSAAMPRAVAEGRLEAADAFTGALAGESPIYELSALPFLTASTEDTRRLLAAARPAYAAALAARGLDLLYATPWPASGLWSRQALPGPEALQGLRVRTYDAASTAVLRAAGAQAVQISFADALPRLRAGELDAVLSSGDGGAGARLWELLPHFTVLDYASPLSLAFCSKVALAALPEAAQAAVRQAGEETESRQFAAMATRLAENTARMQANGVTIATSPALRAALAQASVPVIADWVSRVGPGGEAILATYRRG